MLIPGGAISARIKHIYIYTIAIQANEQTRTAERQTKGKKNRQVSFVAYDFSDLAACNTSVFLGHLTTIEYPSLPPLTNKQCSTRTILEL